MEIDFAIGAGLAGRVRVGLLLIEGVSVRERDEALAAIVDAECAALRARYGDGKSSEVPGAQDARTLYKALGIDPTKTRPSNEALLRRALKGEALYRINTLVDALNLSSLREQLPFGLYDVGCVKPPVELRFGRAGEAYEGIRKGPVQVEGRPVLVDAEGPFGNPTSDSLRTCITLGTTRCLVVAYAPAGYAAARLDGVLDRTAAALTQACGGTASLKRQLA
jgi:DNA/RNA-binding domain of Phe-tRNA-synthetase-like protein